jgi:redox-sensitive bicupin YhaK (pirin superfamily)
MTGPRPVELVRPAQDHGEFRPVFPDQEMRLRLRPFVFLDHFETSAQNEPWGFDFHPHSGVATFTYLRSGRLEHADSAGNGGSLGPGAVQWMAAGGGVWHRELFQPDGGAAHGLQLWVQLPPELEHADVDYQTVGELHEVGPARVLIGELDGARSPIDSPVRLDYLDVRLGAGDRWTHEPPVDHDVAWLYAYEGSVRASGSDVPHGNLAVFDRGGGALELEAAEGAAGLVLGTAPASPWPIVAGRGSMHTSREALSAGIKRIAELGAQLREEH